MLIHCDCPTVRKKFPVFFEKFSSFPYQKGDERQVSQFRNVIQFIRQEYAKPINAHKDKILVIRECPIMFHCWSVLFDYNIKSKCIWHTIMLAQKGLPEAQFYMGKDILNFKKNEIMESDLATAFRWLIMASDSGYTDAYYIAGRICNGLNDHKNAIMFWKKGIAKSNISYMYALADFYFYTLREYNTSLSFYKMAADRNHYQSIAACAGI